MAGSAFQELSCIVLSATTQCSLSPCDAPARAEASTRAMPERATAKTTRAPSLKSPRRGAVRPNQHFPAATTTAILCSGACTSLTKMLPFVDGGDGSMIEPLPNNAWRIQHFSRCQFEHHEAISAMADNLLLGEAVASDTRCRGVQSEECKGSLVTARNLTATN